MDEVFMTLTEILDSTFLCKEKNGKLILQDSTSKPVEIRRSGKTLCIVPDKKGVRLFPYFRNGVVGLNKVVDRIIFCQKENSIYIFIIELKTSNPNNAMSQLNAGFELAKFILATSLRLVKYRTVNIEYRGIVFSARGIKGTTKPKNLKYETHPESKLKFTHLQSGLTVHLDALTY